MTYAEKLKDPRWQKKRLEILQRDDFTCQVCFDNTNTLHVHHLSYEKGIEPWEYPGCSLITLCASCHEDNHKKRGIIEQSIIEKLRFQLKDNFILSSFDGLLGYHPLFEELILGLSEVDPFVVIQFLQGEQKKLRVNSRPVDLLDPCGACGHKRMKKYPKYEYIKCPICGYSVYYGNNPTEAT